MTSGFSVGTKFTLISPLCQDDPDTIFGDDRDAFEDFHYSPFNIRPESDEDDAPMTIKKFKVLNSKLDYLLESTKALPNNEYPQASVKYFLETLMMEHDANLNPTNKTIADLEQTCKETTKKSINYFMTLKALWRIFALHMNSILHL